jgi:hypothetical protein
LLIKNRGASSDSLFKWKRLTGELLFVFSSKLADPLKSEDSKAACPLAWALDNGLFGCG